MPALQRACVTDAPSSTAHLTSPMRSSYALTQRHDARGCATTERSVTLGTTRLQQSRLVGAGRLLRITTDIGPFAREDVVGERFHTLAARAAPGSWS